MLKKNQHNTYYGKSFMGSKSNESSPDPDISEKGNDSRLMTTTPSLVNISKINADVERNIGQILIK